MKHAAAILLGLALAVSSCETADLANVPAGWSSAAGDLCPECAVTR